MRVLDLFSGIGGFSLGLESAGMETVAFCEQDKFCQKVLAHHWPTLPIHSDITELNGYEYRGSVELVCGGFPCQPFSVAGKRLGKEDDRALWPEMLRVIREVAPRWVIGENVSGIIPMELDQVLSDLEGEGYTCWTFVIPACAVDAHHRRDRVWIVAHAHSNSERDVAINAETPRQMVAHPHGSRQQQGDEALAGRSSEQPNGACIQSTQANVSDPNKSRLQRWLQDGIAYQAGWEVKGDGLATQRGAKWKGGRDGYWATEPDVGRVVNGVPNRSHRLKALGNAVVPPLVAEIGRIIMDYDTHQS